MKKLISILMLLTILITPSCVPEENITQSPLGQLAIQYAIMRFVADDYSKVVATLDTIHNLKQFVDGSEIISINIVHKKAIGLINWEGMHPADKMLVESLIALILDDITKKIGAGPLCEAGRAQVISYLNWLDGLVRMLA